MARAIEIEICDAAAETRPDLPIAEVVVAQPSTVRFGQRWPVCVEAGGRVIGVGWIRRVRGGYQATADLSARTWGPTIYVEAQYAARAVRGQFEALVGR